MAVFRPTMRRSFRFDLFYPREAMKGIPAIYFGSAQVKPSHIPALEQALFEKFATLTVVNLADVRQRIQQAVNQVALVIRFLAGFAILAGVIILSSSVAGTRYRRIREVAVLKTSALRDGASPQSFLLNLRFSGQWEGCWAVFSLIFQPVDCRNSLRRPPRLISPQCSRP